MSIKSRQRKPEKRALAFLRKHGQIPFMTPGDAVGNGQAQARTFADLLGGKKRLKDTFTVFRGNTGAVILDLDNCQTPIFIGTSMLNS